uniref:Uncharacterized protein n=1 Tax=Avena sativa TaxID=4498 RepID=A0ACD5WMW0_AVESA
MPPPPPMLQPYDPRRGLLSCFTTQDGAHDPISAATDETLRDLLLDHYEGAFRRLPVDDVPADVDLAQVVDLGGLCLGLLDPVANIVLNTVSLLPHGFGTTNTTPWPRHRHERSRDEWRAVAWKSSRCLLEFMRAYFGLLTQEQAGRYLVWARADLAMAVVLVEHDLYSPRPAPPDPRSGRTRNSLRLAATHGSHPSPDHLVSLATAWLPQHRLEMLAPTLQDGSVMSVYRYGAYRCRHIYSGLNNRLTVHDLKISLHALRHKEDASEIMSRTVVERTTSCEDLGEGRITITTIVQQAGDHIASLRHHQDMRSMLSSYSMHTCSTVTVPPASGTTASTRLHDSPCTSVVDADASACPYVKSLEMSLYGKIHGFYLRALAMLPSHHIRAVLVAGNCYGPMDPVSNIVLSALWFDANFPLSVADQRTQSHDILDTLTMLRAVSRCLHGLVVLLYATSDQQLPLHDILKYLCYAQGDVSAMLQPHLHRHRLDGTSPSPFVAAATAAQHPQASAMAAFFVSLAPTKLDQLRVMTMSATENSIPLSLESLTKINSIIREETSAMIKPTLLQQAPKLCAMASNILTRKTEAYAQQQSFIRGRIDQALQEYNNTSLHPSEPEYDLDFVCGVAIAGNVDRWCYHVNFMAAAKSSFKSTLFFAEFWLAYQDQSKPSICCPLPQPYDMGRCYYGQESARKIAYPDHLADYFWNDITRGGLNDIEGILDTDFIYFDSQRDVEFAKVLQRMAKKEETLDPFGCTWSIIRAVAALIELIQNHGSCGVVGCYLVRAAIRCSSLRRSGATLFGEQVLLPLIPCLYPVKTNKLSRSVSESSTWPIEPCLRRRRLSRPATAIEQGAAPSSTASASTGRAEEGSERRRRLLLLSLLGARETESASPAAAAALNTDRSRPQHFSCSYYGRELAPKMAYPDRSNDFFSSNIPHGKLNGPLVTAN